MNKLIRNTFLMVLLDTKGKFALSLGLILGISVAGVLLVLLLVAVGVYAVWQKKRAEKAIGLSRPFGNCLSMILQKHSGKKN